MHYNIITWY